MKFLNVTLSLSILSVALGFQPRSLPLAQPRSSLSVLPVEHLGDVHTALSDGGVFSFLADAATTAIPVESATDDSAVAAVKSIMETQSEIAQDKGLWQSYINLFKIALSGIHDAIDGPLRANGITQTWGISIALFTASE